jgi:hypothetical protein
MELYGRQIRPLMHIMITRGELHNIDPDGTFFERAISRAILSRWHLEAENNHARMREKKTAQDGA